MPFPIAAPSKAPSNFKVTAVTSTIITASWQLPSADSRNGIIIGFKLFYKKRGSSGAATTLTIKNGTVLSKDVTGLDIYTEYEFEILAFTSVGNGPKSSILTERTKEDGKACRIFIMLPTYQDEFPPIWSFLSFHNNNRTNCDGPKSPVEVERTKEACI